MGGVLDTSSGKRYTPDEVKNNPELKKMIEKKINENINKALSSV